MSIEFTAASSQRLLNSATDRAGPTVYPFTVAMWFLPRLSAALRYFWWSGQTGATTNYWGLGHDAADEIVIDARNTTLRSAGTPTTITLNRWHFVLGRFVSATARAIDVLWQDERTDSANSATSATPTTNAAALGCLAGSTPANFFDGAIAEFWWVNRSLVGHANATALNKRLLRDLAYGGPFSPAGQYLLGGWPTEYRPFLTLPVVPGGTTQYAAGGAENLNAGISIQKWNNVNGVRFGFPHPPLPPEYIRPGQRKGVLVF